MNAIVYARVSTDDQAKKVGEALKKNSITPEDELADAIDDNHEILPLLNPTLGIGPGGLTTY